MSRLTQPKSRRRFGSFAASIGLALVLGAGAAMAQPLLATNFSYTGAAQTWDVPTNVSLVQVSVVGGKGGNAQFGSCGANGTVGGHGASVTAMLSVTPGSQLTILVAGNGSDGCGGGSSAGGFNGGGTGGNGIPLYSGGGGGGASTVSSGGTVLVVAAGGGGSGAWQHGGDAGQPGGTGATAGYSYGVGGGAGTLTGGGAGGAGGVANGAGNGAAGAIGQGGAGGSAQYYAGGGGGGGGFYGGGGGQGSNGGNAGGGGGGSSYAVDTNAVFTVDASGVPSVSIIYGPSLLIPPTLTGPGTGTFLVGLSNSLTFSTSGSPAPAWSLSGTLPASVGFNNGLLSGMPSASDIGSYSLAISATNGVLPGARLNFTLNVVGPNTLAAHPSFNTNGPGWALNGDTINGGPNITNNTFTLTDGTGGETRSAWFRYPLYVGGFQASFTYQDIGGGGADGTAFVIQNSPQGTAAIGGGGGDLSYGTIPNSVAVLLNIYAGSPGGTGWMLGTNGVCAYDLSGQLSGRSYQSTAPVNLAGGNPIQVGLSYTGGMLRLSLTDTVTSATFQTNVAVDVTSLAGTNAAYVGFTGSEGGSFSHQTVSNFSYTPLPTLAASRNQSGSLVITWPATSYGFTLQSNSNLTNPAGWTTVAATVTQTNGMNQVVIPSPTGTQFYRLAL